MVGGLADPVFVIIIDPGGRLHLKNVDVAGRMVGSTRLGRGLWLLGLGLGVALAAIVPETMFPGVRPAVFGVAFLGCGLVGELIHAAREKAHARALAAVRDIRPADGAVEIARVTGLDGELNVFDPRFRKFLRPADARLDDPRALTEAEWPSRTCPPFLGRVVIASLFIGRDGKTWSERELAEAHESILRAAAWLEGEATRYNVAANVEVADTYFVADDEEADEVAVGFSTVGHEVGPFEKGASTKALHRATRAAAELGFADAPTLFSAVADRVAADQTVWLMHPRELGRSFAVPIDHDAPGRVSLAVCYPGESSFPSPLVGPARVDPVTVAHELLHLFGASDKYGRPLREFDPGTVTSREVMRLSSDRLSRLSIDPATAAEIGWVKTR